MATEIMSWEIVNGKLIEIQTSLIEQGRKEKEDLEQWIKSEPRILGSDIRIIGDQVKTSSGPLDLLGIDLKGNMVIVELKRDQLPREALAQAIDYASDIASWDTDKINEVCINSTEQTLADFISENFQDIDVENLVINGSQRIVLVGFSIEDSLARMIEWLSSTYDVAVNAIILKYVKTSAQNELLSRIAVISETVEKEKINRKYKGFEKSDEPGNYEEEELRHLFKSYLLKDLHSSERIKKVMLPLLLKANTPVTRKQLKDEFLKHGGGIGGENTQQAGIFISLISNQLGQKSKDYLRQVIKYEYPVNPWEKDNFIIRPEYREMVREVLEELNTESVG